MPPLVYLDVCCLNRPFDDQRQPRTRLEAEAVREVLRSVAEGRVVWLGSAVLDLEIARNPDVERRHQVATLASMVTRRVTLAREDHVMAWELEARGLGAFDALHLVAAERGRADVLLTTDDRFLRRTERLSMPPHVRVVNPVLWVTEGSTI